MIRSPAPQHGSQKNTLFGAALISSTLLLPMPPASAQLIQQGDKLVGAPVIGSADQGWSVALSGDGSTAIVGGPSDNSNIGAAWVFTRNTSGTWNPQGQKFNINGSFGALGAGTSVAISADGNTAVLGGPGDNNNTGAAWIFTRNGGSWTQQAKLTGDNVSGQARLGAAVALSGDSNTAIVGGPSDSSGVGAAWVFTRTGAVWSQQGPKLIANGAGPAAHEGASVALSADGNTAILGGPGYNNDLGAAWVFVRNGSQWAQQSGTLVGSNSDRHAVQGFSVALAADGNTAIIGGPNYFGIGPEGAAWVFVRNGGAWSEQGKLVGTGVLGSFAQQGFGVALSGDGNLALAGGRTDNNGVGATWVFYRRFRCTISCTWEWVQLTKLVGSGNDGASFQGQSVALSGDGNTALIGAPSDHNSTGATWVFGTPNKLVQTASHDFNGDGKSDIAWRQIPGGSTAIWLMNGAQIAQTGNLGVVPDSWQIVGQRDFNNDGSFDLLWRDSNSGTVVFWFINNLAVSSYVMLGSVPSNWVIYGTSDFNYDGKGDILWRDTNTGTVAIWLTDGPGGTLGVVPMNWQIAASDRTGNIFWRDSGSGTVALWEVYAFQVLQSASLGVVSTNWVIAGVGDFDGNGSTDILWLDNSGNVAIWLMNGLSVLQAGGLGNVGTSWNVAQTGDYNGDGKSDILWRDNSGNTAIWFMNGLQIGSAAGLGNIPTTWTVQGINVD
jgi:hypothetical protein